MILIVSGVTSKGSSDNGAYKFHQEHYAPKTDAEAKKKIKEDFGNMLSAEMSKLKINILI